MSVLHVVGARPNFPKAAPVYSSLESLGIDQCLLHTGQHYDKRLSDWFFRDLDIPTPDVYLDVGSDTHAEQTARLMSRLGEYLGSLAKPDLVIVYGDINSTVAAAMVAVKLGIPIAHVEAGLRSGDRSMPEEVNRVVVDTLSTLLFATSPEALANLAREGIGAERVHFVGNPMIDSLLKHLSRAKASAVLSELAIPPIFALATLHRPSNVDDDNYVIQVKEALEEVADIVPIVMPLHPRGRARLMNAGLGEIARLSIVDPLCYLDFVCLMDAASVVITDSGGVQEETTILGTPCLTLRPNTERPVTIEWGTNRLTNPAALSEQVQVALQMPITCQQPPPLWDGYAGERIGRRIAAFLDSRTRSSVNA